MTLDLTALPRWAHPEEVLESRYFPEAPWAKALEVGDAAEAVSLFLQMIRQAPPRLSPQYLYANMVQRWFDVRIGQQGGHAYDANDVCEKKYCGVYNITHQFEGDIDWLCDPTKDWGEKQTPEWVVQFNRHYHWVTLCDAYNETHDAKYLKAWEAELLSWVEQCPRPNFQDWSLPGTWRTIDVGIRAGWTWPYAFETFRTCEGLSDKALWYMIAMIREHGMYLLYWPFLNNFKLMEANGLMICGLLLPELRNTHSFITTATDRLIAQMEQQYYSDGMQVELAPHYGACVCLTNLFAPLMQMDLILHQEALPGHPVRNAIRDLRLAMVRTKTKKKLRIFAEAIARIAYPDASVPELSDSGDFYIEKAFRELDTLFSETPQTQMPWETDGVDVLPYAGHAILRQQGRFALMDAGPWGSGHQHSDALHILTASGTTRWLADSGKPFYNRDATTWMQRSSAGHNVVQMDGLSHMPHPCETEIDEPYPVHLESSDTFLLMSATRQQNAEGNHIFTHARAVLDVQGIGWLILDRVESADNAPHTWEWLWHFAEGSLSINGERACCAHPAGEFGHLQMAGCMPVSICEQTGQTEPAPRGWQANAKTGTLSPLPVLSATTKSISGPCWMATLLTVDADSATDATLAKITRSDTQVDVTCRRGDAELALRCSWRNEVLEVAVL